ncbi:hypothetical protein HK405_004592 [Cladochytrium tenue]|nr:hypothetical protein HK405_004592 [Cladochytrium tenue]
MASSLDADVAANVVSGAGGRTAASDAPHGLRPQPSRTRLSDALSRLFGSGGGGGGAGVPLASSRSFSATSSSSSADIVNAGGIPDTATTAADIDPADSPAVGAGSARRLFGSGSGMTRSLSLSTQPSRRPARRRPALRVSSPEQDSLVAAAALAASSPLPPPPPPMTRKSARVASNTPTSGSPSNTDGTGARTIVPNSPEYTTALNEYLIEHWVPATSVADQPYDFMDAAMDDDPTFRHLLRQEWTSSARMVTSSGDILYTFTPLLGFRDSDSVISSSTSSSLAETEPASPIVPADFPTYFRNPFGAHSGSQDQDSGRISLTHGGPPASAEDGELSDNLPLTLQFEDDGLLVVNPNRATLVQKRPILVLEDLSDDFGTLGPYWNGQKRPSDATTVLDEIRSIRDRTGLIIGSSGAEQVPDIAEASSVSDFSRSESPALATILLGSSNEDAVDSDRDSGQPALHHRHHNGLHSHQHHHNHHNHHHHQQQRSSSPRVSHPSPPRQRARHASAAARLTLVPPPQSPRLPQTLSTPTTSSPRSMTAASSTPWARLRPNHRRSVPADTAAAADVARVLTRVVTLERDDGRRSVVRVVSAIHTEPATADTAHTVSMAATAAEAATSTAVAYLPYATSIASSVDATDASPPPSPSRYSPRLVRQSAVSTTAASLSSSSHAVDPPLPLASSLAPPPASGVPLAADAATTDPQLATIIIPPEQYPRHRNQQQQQQQQHDQNHLHPHRHPHQQNSQLYAAAVDVVPAPRDPSGFAELFRRIVGDGPP